jgi:predicted cupin superfamily sugar epimerase
MPRWRVNADALIKSLNLSRHPEGGWYREVYRSRGSIAPGALPRRYGGPRRYATSILYLLQAGERSAFHRVHSDELWHVHLGGPLSLCEISPRGRPRCIALGTDVRRGHAFFHVVRAGTWFAARPAPGVPFVLVGCTVAPGFEFADFELARPGALESRWPRLAPLVRKYR